jgi:hypothetical protein
MGQSLSFEINDPVLGQMFIRVTPLEAIRGPLAIINLKGASSSNPYPHVGQKYVLVRIRFQYLKGPDPDTQLNVSISDFTAVSSSGREYVTPLVIAHDPVLSANLYPGLQ